MKKKIMEKNGEIFAVGKKKSSFKDRATEKQKLSAYFMIIY